MFFLSSCVYCQYNHTVIGCVNREFLGELNPRGFGRCHTSCKDELQGNQRSSWKPFIHPCAAEN